MDKIDFILLGMIIGVFIGIGYFASKDDEKNKNIQNSFETTCFESGGVVLTNSTVKGKIWQSSKNCVDSKMFIKIEETPRN